MSPEAGMRQMRGVLPHYFKGFAGANRVRQQITQVLNLESVRVLFGEIFPEVNLDHVSMGAAFEGHRAATLDGHSSREKKV